MATQWAMLTCLLALLALALLELPDDEPPDEPLPPHATTPATAADSNAPATTRLIALSSSCSDSAQLCATRPGGNVSGPSRLVKEPDIDACSHSEQLCAL